MRAAFAAMAIGVGCIAVVGSARAQAPRLEEVVTATADARDLGRLSSPSGDRVLVATEGGLVVLRDGRVERTLGPRDGMPGARIRSVSVIGEEAWIGAVEGTVRVGLVDDAVAVIGTVSSEGRPVRRVARAARFASHVWLASHGGGLFRMDGDTPHPIRLGTAHAYVRLTDLRVVGDELWVATSGVGILRVSAEGRVVGRIRQGDGLPSDYLWRLVPDGDRVLATGIAGLAEIATDGTVDRRGAITATARRLPVHDVRDVTRTDDAIWFATFGQGLWRAPSEGGRPRRVGSFDQGYAMVTDGDGVLVAHGGGVHRATGTRAAPVLTGGLPTGDVTALARAFGTLWVGTFEHGLARMRGGASFEPVSTERWSLDRRINDLAVSGHGRAERLWIATDRGLWWHDGRVFARVEDPHGPSWIHATSLHVDARGGVWVTTSRELCRYRNESWQCWTGDERFPVAQLQTVTTDRSGRVWVGSLHGLYRFDEATGRFTRHTVSSGDLPVDWVTALVPWGRGVMAGTYHGGLAIGDGEGFRIVREGQDGLPSGWVNPHAIERVGDDAWIGTLERGLMVGRPGAWRHVTTADGLPSDDVTGVLAERDAVWVATRGGLARFARAGR